MPSRIDDGRVTTKAVMWLHDYYDHRQLWLPFVCATYLQRDELSIENNKQTWHDMATLKKNVLPHVMKTPDKAAQLMYHPTEGVDQPGLPFVEHQQVSKAEYEVLRRMQWPAWEITESPILITDNIDTTELHEWLRDCCKGRFYLADSFLLLQYASDYAMTVLRFHK